MLIWIESVLFTYSVYKDKYEFNIWHEPAINKYACDVFFYKDHTEFDIYHADTIDECKCMYQNILGIILN